MKAVPVCLIDDDRIKKLATRAEPVLLVNAQGIVNLTESR
jgi:hypothetical protein